MGSTGFSVISGSPISHEEQQRHGLKSWHHILINRWKENRFTEDAQSKPTVEASIRKRKEGKKNTLTWKLPHKIVRIRKVWIFKKPSVYKDGENNAK